MITTLFLAQAIENGDRADRYTAGETKVAPPSSVTRCLIVHNL